MSNLGSSNTTEVQSSAVPRHVAVIMDGNGRWARRKGHPRVFGHKYGAERVREIVECAGQNGVKHLTLYAFSDENWRRPVEEIGAIMHLLEHYLRKERRALLEKNVRFKTIGDLSRLSTGLQKLIEETVDMLDDNTGLTLIVAVSYGGRAEITRAVKKIADKVLSGELKLDQIDQDLISNHLDTSGVPDPDLLIRTSGELRISNFLLWQCAYTEFYFTDVNWPDFDSREFEKALFSYSNRERRFGQSAGRSSAGAATLSKLGASTC